MNLSYEKPPLTRTLLPQNATIRLRRRPVRIIAGTGRVMGKKKILKPKQWSTSRERKPLGMLDLQVLHRGMAGVVVPRDMGGMRVEIIIFQTGMEMAIVPMRDITLIVMQGRLQLSKRDILGRPTDSNDVAIDLQMSIVQLQRPLAIPPLSRLRQLLLLRLARPLQYPMIVHNMRLPVRAPMDLPVKAHLPVNRQESSLLRLPRRPQYPLIAYCMLAPACPRMRPLVEPPLRTLSLIGMESITTIPLIGGRILHFVMTLGLLQLRHRFPIVLIAKAFGRTRRAQLRLDPQPRLQGHQEHQVRHPVGGISTIIGTMRVIPRTTVEVIATLEMIEAIGAKETRAMTEATN